jgi:hypothetical protein
VSFKVLAITDLLEMFGACCFCEARSLSSVAFESGWRLPRIEMEHSMELVSWTVFVLDWFKLWVPVAILSANRFPRLDLNQVQECHELRKEHSGYVRRIHLAERILQKIIDIEKH